MSSQSGNGSAFKTVLKSKMENPIFPLRFQKSNYVIRLFSNKQSLAGTFLKISTLELEHQLRKSAALKQRKLLTPD